MREPLFSVVIPTHERPGDLARCLESLRQLDDPVDVLVVDSASDPPVEPIVARFPGVRYVFEPVPGASRARNRGIAETSSPLIAFLDDDTVVAPDWARRLAVPFEDPRVACVGGTCRPLFDAPRPGWLSDRLLQFAGITRIGSAPREARSTPDYPFSANICFRRSALEAIGGFREDLGRSGKCLLSGEDPAAVEAVRRHGWKVWLQPDAVVDHAVQAERCSSGYYWRRLWWQGITRARQEQSLRVTLRLTAAAPIRFTLWLATRDRVHLYRTAETAGYFAELARVRSFAR
jgi:GT2 family glycosyltransferase